MGGVVVIAFVVYLLKREPFQRNRLIIRHPERIPKLDNGRQAMPQLFLLAQFIKLWVEGQ